MSTPNSQSGAAVNRGITGPDTNAGSFAPKNQTVPGLGAHLSDNTASQRLRVAIALLDTGIRRRSGEDFTEPVSFDVIKGELRSMSPGVDESAFDEQWADIRVLAEDVSAMERLWDESERTGDWDGFDDYAWDASVEKDDFLVEDEEDDSHFIDVHDYAGTILADYEARMHDQLQRLVNAPGAAGAETDAPASETATQTASGAA